MHLTASLIVRNELGRLLSIVIADLRTYCDSIIVLDDASDDGTREWLEDEVDDQLSLGWNRESKFYAHEGRARGQLLQCVLNYSDATHVLAVDADELVSDGQALRAALERSPDVPLWSLAMTEVWTATAAGLRVRTDGGWRVHPRPMLWRVPDNVRDIRMLDRKLACARIPAPLLRERARPVGASCLHFGWTDPTTRQARYDRYTKHDGGRFHASSHLQSIMWPESRMRFDEMAWPDMPWADAVKARLL